MGGFLSNATPEEIREAFTSQFGTRGSGEHENPLDNIPHDAVQCNCE